MRFTHETSIEKDVYYFFTDGSCWPNPGGPGGWAYVCVKNNIPIRRRSGGLKKTTTNRAELYAILHAMIRATRLGEPCIIVTDSAYCYDGMTKNFSKLRDRNWNTHSGNEPARNVDLIKRMLAIYMPYIRFAKVKGHSGIHYNEIADILAGEQRKRIQKKLIDKTLNSL